jgi:hypothetical protein
MSTSRSIPMTYKPPKMRRSGSAARQRAVRFWGVAASMAGIAVWLSFLGWASWAVVAWLLR